MLAVLSQLYLSLQSHHLTRQDVCCSAFSPNVRSCMKQMSLFLCISGDCGRSSICNSTYTCAAPVAPGGQCQGAGKLLLHYRDFACRACTGKGRILYHSWQEDVCSNRLILWLMQLTAAAVWFAIILASALLAKQLVQDAQAQVGHTFGFSFCCFDSIGREGNSLYTCNISNPENMWLSPTASQKSQGQQHIALAFSCYDLCHSLCCATLNAIDS